MDTEQEVARRSLETRFQSAFTYDVSELAAEHLQEHLQQEGRLEAAERCQALHEPVSQTLWRAFAFDWTKVAPNPGGTGGRASAFMLAKLELSVTWAVAGADAAETQAAQENALECLAALWLEWGGYMVTTPEFEAAL